MEKLNNKTKENIEEIVETNIVEIEESEYKELQEWKRKYLYLLAEFDNYKKRRVHEDHQKMTYVYEDLFKELLIVLDNIERAENNESLSEGVKMVFNSLRDVLVKNGLEYYDIRTSFDEDIHNAVSITNLPNYADNEIVDTIRPGYKYKTKVIRYQDVVVNKNLI